MSLPIYYLNVMGIHREGEREREAKVEGGSKRHYSVGVGVKET
jgi:hypothetical protein